MLQLPYKDTTHGNVLQPNPPAALRLFWWTSQTLSLNYVSHYWLFAALVDMNILARMLHTIHMLYKDLVTHLDFARRTAGTLQMRSGIHQGCPLSGRSVALSLDPWIRRYLSRSVFAHTQIYC